MDNSIITRIKNELDIVDIVSEHVDLSKKGRNYWGLCPFHEDSNPSMSVSPEKQLYKCFVCQNGGDLIKFTSEIKHVSFSESVSKLAKRIGIEYQVNKSTGPKYSDKQQKFIDIHKDAMDFFQYSLSTSKGKNALNYIKARGLNHILIEQFSIGYAPEMGLKKYLLSKGYDEADIINSSLENSQGNDFFRNRLIFGIKNTHGDIVSFSARDLSGKAQAKYINSAETSLFSKNSILYNYSDALEASKKNKEIFINEGFMDVIAMYRVGVRNSVAIMGTALTDNHTKLLRNLKVNLMLDGDKAGISATIKSIKILLKYNINTFVVKNNTGQDPDEIISNDGVEKLIEITNRKIEALEFIYKLHEQKYKNITPNTALEFAKSFSAYLVNQSNLKKDFYTNKLADKLGISKEIIMDNFPQAKSTEVLIPQEQIVEKPKIIAKRKNDTYKLIKSMLKNNKLIGIFKENKSYLVEPILISISNYMIDAYDRVNSTKPSLEMVSKVNEINGYKDYVNTSDEFKELIKRVTIESYKWEKESNDVKLKSISKDEEKLKLLQKNIKLERELRKYED